MQHNVSLRNLNTFGLESRAQSFEEVKSVESLTAIIKNPELRAVPKFILGGGSNILLTQDIDALVIKISIKGIEKVKEDNDHIWLHVGAGEMWHDFVMYCVDNGYAGVENLSLIPGTVGAAPMQNIGAYGVEIKAVVETVETISFEDATSKVFSNDACLFGYRESIFKHELKGQYIITGVLFRLNKKPAYQVTYGDIQKTLEEMGVQTLSIKAVSEAVIRIRRSKLPDPAEIGNAGSFFKNPEIPEEQFNRLKNDFPALPGYPAGEGFVKVPAGWLIEQAGWKGYRDGAIGVHARQALVLVNYGGGSGGEIKLLSQKIQQSIEEKFGIRLNAEVNFI
ncbi:UDP-N-acetylmuramate dehydrogenase [Dyadobacter sp. LHD-138]|uniref:UDP-N-acetylmuramate dehydrogenase n=1 Tax=Dyadobacter sp. LHD-138 TaxID=3071413 RepID=UPI0027E0F83F|nr:UDP-N-acetylmuramate dehydrogenase [Dyadobacter sp. LHD-138]MDQ6482006.1 UDP-N-acetylmuramate dehydrogenase [Dyadobacter sp. LHD-138]